MILKRYIPLFAKDRQSFAFLFDMNELFENFVGKMVQKIDTSAKLQSKNIYGNLVLKPDILMDNLIVDTKYKKISNKEDLTTTDKYQMFVYGKNYKIANTMLLYPKHINHINEDLVLGKDENRVGLVMRSLDLDFGGGYEEFVLEMENRVREIVCE